MIHPREITHLLADETLEKPPKTIKALVLPYTVAMAPMHDARAGGQGVPGLAWYSVHRRLL